MIEREGLRFLRPYQLNAIIAVQKAVAEDKNRFLMEMATGTGKTLLSAALIKLFLKTKNARRVLFLVDRIELEKKILNRQSIVPTQNIEIIPSSKSNSNNLVFNEILKKLEKFEEKNKFTEKGLTLNQYCPK